MFSCSWIRVLSRSTKKLFGSYVVFTKATPFIFGVILSHSIADYTVVKVLMNHLTETWGQSVAKSAIIVNIVEGSTAVLMLLVAHLCDAYLKFFRGVLCFYAVFIFGLLLARFFPGDPASESIHKLYVGLALVTLGSAGEIPLRDLMDVQLRELEKKTSEEQTDSQDQRIQDRLEIWWYCPWFIGAGIAAFWVSNWVVYTLVSAIVMAVALALFWSGHFFQIYQHIPVNSPLTKIYYVVKVAMLKRHQQYPNLADQFLNNEHHHLHLLPDRPFLRWVDKAAIIDRNPTFGINSVQQEEETNPIEVEDVEEVKFFLMMAPMWSTLLIYGIVESMYNTFFFQQASNINPDFQVIVFMLIKSVTAIVSPLLFPDRLWGNRRSMVLLKIGIGIMCSVLCCVVAYIVQVRYTQNSGIAILWLTPHFIFIGLMKGLVEDGIEDLLTDQVSESMTIYGMAIVEFVKGLSRFLCVLLILCFRSWFDDDLSHSQLHKYYGLLGIFCVGNIFWYKIVMQTYLEEQPETDENNQDCFPITICQSRLQRNQSSIRQRPAEEGSRKVSSNLKGKQPNDNRDVSGDSVGQREIEMFEDHNQQQHVEGIDVNQSVTSALLKHRSFSNSNYISKKTEECLKRVTTT